MQGIRVNEQFAYDPTGRQYSDGPSPLNPADYDLIWLRLPHPIHPEFIRAMDDLDRTEKTIVVNRPSGVVETGNKAYLLNWEKFTAPTYRWLNQADDIRAFAKDHPIVLKPLRGHGGAGITKVTGDEADTGGAKRCPSRRG